MTKTEYQQALKDLCPQCAAGLEARFRKDTKEYVHDRWQGNLYIHSYCLATGLRLSEAGKQFDGQ